MAVMLAGIAAAVVRSGRLLAHTQLDGVQVWRVLLEQVQGRQQPRAEEHGVRPCFLLDGGLQTCYHGTMLLEVGFETGWSVWPDSKMAK
jgi:hypothetical protein